MQGLNHKTKLCPQETSIMPASPAHPASHID
jgi:hypothetical protein